MTPAEDEAGASGPGDPSAGVWAGVDLGGTGTRAVVVDASNTVIDGVTVASASFDGDPVAGLASLVAGVVPAGSRLLGVGVGASGPVDLRTGLVHNPDTLPWFTGRDVAGGLAERLAAPAWIDNDAVVAGLAETTWGEAAGSASTLVVTLGTGIGAVMLQGGAPVRAADGQHPEGGHIPAPGSGHPCYCGLPKCWEQVASRTALDALLSAYAGDTAAAWTAYAEALAGGLVTLLTLYHPACVVIGGGVARWWSRLEAPLRVALSGYRAFDPGLLLLASNLGERAGALGATLLPQRGIGWHPSAEWAPSPGVRSHS